MMMADIDQWREQWITERPQYEEFAKYLHERIEKIIRQLGISAEVAHRPKEVHSLVKKLLLKNKHTYDTLPDKVGVRVVARYRSELPLILQEIQRAFQYRQFEDKGDNLGIDRFGYRSIHVDGLCLVESDERVRDFPPVRFFAELQIRTFAQHLWSEISHDTFYKNDETIVALDSDMKRRVNLMAGHIEVADREFDKMNNELPNLPEARLLVELEKLYYRLTAHRPNLQLSLDVIHLLLPLYKEHSESEIMDRHICPTFLQSEGMLKDVYSRSEDEPQVSAFLFQPEALLLYDRIKADPDAILTAWTAQYPPTELERIANTFGLALN